MTPDSVGVSIVAYRPDAAALLRLLASLEGQAGMVVVVDNGGAATALGAEERDRVVIVDPGRNVGVAAGHNLALARIFGAGFRHALLFDQDSLPQPGMIGELLRIEQALLDHGVRVAAVGPTAVAADGRQAGFVKFTGVWRRILDAAEAGLPVPACRCDFLITSGTLLRREAFERIGAFDESLFIDNVDLEWCCRATAQGLGCYGAVETRMQHALGDRSLRNPVVRNKVHAIHGPQRMYYMTRNRLLLYRLSHVPLGWKIADMPRMLGKIVVFALAVAPRVRYLRAFVGGLVDGVRGRGGPTADRY